MPEKQRLMPDNHPFYLHVPEPLATPFQEVPESVVAMGESEAIEAIIF
jgi:hypothetical protein